MKLTVLAENNSRTDKYLLAEPALSFYIETENKKILFDCGYSDVFIKNAFKLGINLRNTDDIVFSHGHNDHTGGIFYLKQLFQDSVDLKIKVNKPNIIAHINTFNPIVETEMGNVGSPLVKNQLSDLFDLNLTKNPYWITDKLCFLGEIPRTNLKIENFPDDSALIYKENEEIIIITGCSHSGLQNIIEYAKEIAKTKKIKALIGGFHLINKTKEEMNEIINYLKTQDIECLYPCHCCDLMAKSMIFKEFNTKEVCVGDVFKFDKKNKSESCVSYF